MNREQIKKWKDDPYGATGKYGMTRADFKQLCDLALRGLEAGEPSGMVLVPREQLQKWHAVTAQLCGTDEWGREMQDQMWALLSAAPEVKP